MFLWLVFVCFVLLGQCKTDGCAGITYLSVIWM